MSAAEAEARRRRALPRVVERPADLKLPRQDAAPLEEPRQRRVDEAPLPRLP